MTGAFFWLFSWERSAGRSVAWGNEGHGRAKNPALVGSRSMDKPLGSPLMEMGRF